MPPITLVSKWLLRDGYSSALDEALGGLCSRVAHEEPGTLLYLVNVEARSPLGDAEQPPRSDPIPAPAQTRVVFIEVYRDADAFAAHVNGPIFTRFRETWLHAFYEDPSKPGWPHTETEFYERRFSHPGNFGGPT